MSGDAALRAAIADAYVMLDFAVKKGIDIRAEEIEVFAKTRTVKGQLSPEDEAVFWKSLEALSVAVKPATIDSLRALQRAPYTVSFFKWKLAFRWFSMAQRSVFNYTALAMLCLIFLLTFQVYSYVGMTALRDIERFDKELDEIGVQISKVENMEMNDDEKAEILDGLYERRKNARDSKKSRYEMLSLWNDVLEVVATKIITKEKYKEFAKAFSDRTATTLALYAINILNTYILPFVFGLLGVCAYILRDMSASIKADAFIPRKKIGYRLRLALGSLAGVSIGYLFKPESGGVLFEKLTPLGVAFVLGYGIEVFFTAMDDVIKRLTGKDGAGGKPSMPSQAPPPNAPNSALASGKG